MNGTVELGLVVLSSLMSARGNVLPGPEEGKPISSLIDSYAWTPRGNNESQSYLRDDDIGTTLSIMDYTDGYVLGGLNYFTAPFTDVSHLALIHFYAAFTPGYVIADSGSYSGYHADCHLGVGKIAIHWADVGERTHGEFPPDYVLLDYWPKSTSFTTQLTSQFSNVLSYGCALNFGFDKTLKFGEYVTGEISQTGSILNDFSFTLTQGQSMSSVFQDPVISAQVLPDDFNSPYWRFEVSNPDTAGTVTFHFNCYALYEVKDNAVNMSDYVAKIVVDVENTIKWWDNGFLGFIGQGWKLGDTKTASLTFYHDVPYDAD